MHRAVAEFVLAAEHVAVAPAHAPHVAVEERCLA
jgi:hypothetical protein